MKHKIREIVKMQFGSHVYGTNTPQSDLDYKSVFIPSARSLIMQDAPEHITNNTKLNPTAKNNPTDIDDEAFSVKRFMELLVQGQTVALDMLFTPPEWYIENKISPEWAIILKNREKLIHKGISAFVGYTKKQAAKYGIKGFRVGAIRQTLDWLDQFGDKDKLGECWAKQPMPTSEYLQIIECKGSKKELVPHLEVAGCKMSFRGSVRLAKAMMLRKFKQFGERALLAETNQGIDWKAMMHAVRVSGEAIELLSTGHITFPRPERELLLKIRNGELPYKQVASIIEMGLELLKEAQAQSSLPEELDRTLIEEIVYTLHLSEIVE